MDRITKILVPFDFTPPSKAALRYAIDFVGTRPDKHLVICFLHDNKDKDALASTFDEVKAGLSKLFRAKISWIDRTPPSVEGLIETSNSEKADLVIMGTSGSQDLEGTTHTSQMVLSTNCPVLVVPGGVDADFQLKKIALVLGPKEIEDTKVLATLLDISRTFNAQVSVLTIQHKPIEYGYSEGEEQNEELLEYYLQNFYAEHVYIKSDDVVQGIFDYVTNKEMDMIAILPRNHVRKETGAGGRLTRILTLQTETPLLAIEH